MRFQLLSKPNNHKFYPTKARRNRTHRLFLWGTHGRVWIVTKTKFEKIKLRNYKTLWIRISWASKWSISKETLPFNERVKVQKKMNLKIDRISYHRSRYFLKMKRRKWSCCWKVWEWVRIDLIILIFFQFNILMLDLIHEAEYKNKSHNHFHIMFSDFINLYLLYSQLF